jgi:hypothetical protein
MEIPMATQKSFDAREKIALTVSAAILIVSVVYWVNQILGVMEMLKLAYG